MRILAYLLFAGSVFLSASTLAAGFSSLTTLKHSL